MSYQVLARKWRPKKFEEVIGQSHITKSLQNALNRNQIGHAFLLSGTRGIGKTTVARIFAKALRCQNRDEQSNPCNSCESCDDFHSQSSMNVIEIDGASNNSVDDVRELISNVQYLPTVGNYKVYIIDEVHMLSANAFNALLKTLEEPPEHAVFILATTEPEKLLGTVLSRCQRFDFRNAQVTDLSDHLNHIASVEGITFENQKLVEIICRLGNGSVRDTLSLLDQVLNFSENNNVTEGSVSVALGIAKVSAINELIDSVLSGNCEEVKKIIKSLISENIQVKSILTSLMENLYSGIEENSFDKEYSIQELLWVYETIAKDSKWIMESLSPVISLELSLKKLSLRREFFSNKISFQTTTEKKNEELETSKDSELEKVSEVAAEDKSVETVVEEKVSEELPPHVTEEVPVEEQEPEAGPDFSILRDAMDNTEVQTIQPEAQVEDNEEKKHQFDAPSADVEKDWDNFLKYLSELSPASCSNLEQGNLLRPIAYDGKNLSVDFGFSKSGKVFYDFLSEPESKEKLIALLKSFFECETVALNLTLLGAEEESESNFISRADIKEKEELKEKQIKEEGIANDPLIKAAEDAFSSKVDKVILNK